MNLKAFSTISEGLIVGPKFEGRLARVRHDTVARTEGMKLQMTNEVFPCRPVQDGKVNPNSKIITKLANRAEWVNRFREMMGAFVLGQFATHGYGWMDTNHDIHEYKFGLIQCGGNLVNVTAIENEYAYLQTQDFYQSPDSSLTYRHAPHLVIKQVLVGNSATQKIFWITDKKRGDVVFPAVSPVQAAFPVEQLEFFPELPWATWINGEYLPVVVKAYRFVGSDTYGLIDDTWRLLEEMKITGNGSHLDRQVYVENWIDTCPPPVIGWTRNLE